MVGFVRVESRSPCESASCSLVASSSVPSAAAQRERRTWRRALLGVGGGGMRASVAGDALACASPWPGTETSASGSPASRICTTLRRIMLRTSSGSGTLAAVSGGVCRCSVSYASRKAYSRSPVVSIGSSAVPSAVRPVASAWRTSVSTSHECTSDPTAMYVPNMNAIMLATSYSGTCSGRRRSSSAGGASYAVARVAGGSSATPYAWHRLVQSVARKRNVCSEKESPARHAWKT